MSSWRQTTLELECGWRRGKPPHLLGATSGKQYTRACSCGTVYLGHAVEEMCIACVSFACAGKIVPRGTCTLVGLRNKGPCSGGSFGLVVSRSPRTRRASCPFLCEALTLRERCPSMWPFQTQNFELHTPRVLGFPSCGPSCACTCPCTRVGACLHVSVGMFACTCSLLYACVYVRVSGSCYQGICARARASVRLSCVYVCM